MQPDYKSEKESRIRTDDTLKDEPVEPDKQVKFANHIKQLLKQTFSDDQNRMIMTIEELGDKVGIKRGVFAKIVNQSRPNKHVASRDCIIAICAVLGLDKEGTNRTLHIYQMAALDCKLKREKKIIDELQYGHDTLEEFNEALMSEPNPVEPLHVINPRGASREVSVAEEERPFIIKKPAEVKTYTEDDPYDSLETAYGFHRYSIFATMLLRERATGKVYELTADPAGNLSLMEGSLLRYERYKSVKEAGEFEEYFKRLLKMAKAELRRHAAHLNDTKNYGQRIGAGIRDDAFVLFVEEYNYQRPERNEYYLMEYANGKCRLSVSHDSRFMQIYLSPAEYRTYYREENPHPFVVYESLAEIEEKIDKYRNDVDRRGLLRLRKKAYEKLKAVVFEHLEKLRNTPEKPASEFVRNIDAIWECRDKVCWYYKVMPNFRCQEDEEADWVEPGLTEMDFPIGGDRTITITLGDLYRAFELGFHDIQEICRIKARLGSIEEVIG